MKTDEVTGGIGAILHLPDLTAHGVVILGNGVLLDDGGRDVQPPAPAGSAPGTLTHVGEETSQPEPEEEKDESSEPPKRPYGNAPKSAWVEYAVAADSKMTKERAEGMTKVDLMSRYGEPL
jgi:hypothetical protein